MSFGTSSTWRESTLVCEIACKSLKHNCRVKLFLNNKWELAIYNCDNVNANNGKGIVIRTTLSLFYELPILN